MSVGGSASYSKSKQKSTGVQTTLLGDTGQQIQSINLELAQQQLRLLMQQEDFQNQLYSAGKPLVDDFGRQLDSMDQFATDYNATGAATAEQKRLIEDATNSALAKGQSDIRAGLQEGLGLIRSELAPGLGLRPGDSPLIDRGGLLAREALRQEGNLALGLRSQQAATELEYPAKQDIAIKDFQASLRDSAFRNRLALTGNIAQLGLGLSQPSSFASKFEPEVALATKVDARHGYAVNNSVSGSGSYGGSSG